MVECSLRALAGGYFRRYIFGLAGKRSQQCVNRYFSVLGDQCGYVLTDCLFLKKFSPFIEHRVFCGKKFLNSGLQILHGFNLSVNAVSWSGLAIPAAFNLYIKELSHAITLRKTYGPAAARIDQKHGHPE